MSGPDQRVASRPEQPGAGRPDQPVASRLDRTIGRGCRRVVGACVRHPRVVVIAALLLACAGIMLTVGRLGMNTDLNQLISADEPWRQRELAFDAAFPQFTGRLVVVVDAAPADGEPDARPDSRHPGSRSPASPPDSQRDRSSELAPDLVEDGARRLAAALARRTDLFRRVDHATGDPFFQRHGLLFLPTDEVSATLEGLVDVQPLIGTLAADTSLRGLLATLTLAFEGVIRGQNVDRLTAPLTALADSAASALTGRPRPVSWQSLLGGSGEKHGLRQQIIVTQPARDFSRLQAGEAAMAAVRETARALALDREHGVRVRLTGSVAIEAEELDTVAAGAALSTTVSFLLVAFLLWAGLRSPRVILANLITLVVGLCLTTAYAAAAVGTLNPISVAFAVLFIGMAIDFGIQVAVRYREEIYHLADEPATDGRSDSDPAGRLRPEPDETAGRLRPDPDDPAGRLRPDPDDPAGRLRPDRAAAIALARMAQGVGGSVLLAGVATAVGFFAFLPTAYLGVSELGLIAGVGMLIAVSLNLTLLPALLALMRPPGVRRSVGFAWAAPVDRLLLNRRRTVLAVAAAIAGIATLLTTALPFDSNPINLRDPDSESIATALDLMADPTTSPFTAEIIVGGGMAEAEALAARLEALPEVRSVLWLARFLPEEQAAKLALIADARFLLVTTLSPAVVAPPADPDAVRAALADLLATLRRARPLAAGELAAVLERLEHALTAYVDADATRLAGLESVLIGGLPGRLDALRLALTAAPVSLETLPATLSRDWTTAEGALRLSVTPRGDARNPVVLAAFVEAVQRVAPAATGAAVSAREGARTVITAFLEASLYALLGITVLLGIALGRARDVMLVLAPLGLAAVLTGAICVVFGPALNFANVIALPLLLSLGVAFNIYFVVLWRQGLGSPLQSATARAVVFSALTTLVGFGSLALSPHPGTASMGVLLVIALGCTLATALLVSPALLGNPAECPTDLK